MLLVNYGLCHVLILLILINIVKGWAGWEHLVSQKSRIFGGNMKKNKRISGLGGLGAHSPQMSIFFGGNRKKNKGWVGLGATNTLDCQVFWGI